MIFGEKKSSLVKLGIPPRFVSALHSAELLVRAEKEMNFIRQQGLRACFYLDEDYPGRLKQCEDGPVILYGKGNLRLEAPRQISIVGTRNATTYGREFCDRFIEELLPYQPTIVSGLAYGIDICAHRAALRHDLPTIGVLAHGLNRLYPPPHRETAMQMLEHGGLLTDFPSDAPFHPGNFPSRNRIVAGISEATVVIESAIRGGSLITAEIANSYCREVFAVPGRINDNHSRGCNVLVKKNKAALLESAGDLAHYLGWESKGSPKVVQHQLFDTLNREELKIMNLLQEKGILHIDELCLFTQLNRSHTAGALLELEFKGLVKSLPGSRYSLS